VSLSPLTVHRLVQPRVVEVAGVSAMACFMFALPHFAVPAGATYRPPAASIFLLLWAFFMMLQPGSIRMKLADPGGLRRLLIVFFLYCIVSAVYGYLNLAGQGLAILQLTTGDVFYPRVSAERLLQLLLVIVAFEVVRNSSHDYRRMMRWWLIGTTGAVVLHAFTYLITSDFLLQRAGTFNEGNLAGLYYLLSVFVALEYQRIAPDGRGRWHFLLIAMAGMLLSRSAAGVVVLVFLLSAKFAFKPARPSSRVMRLLLVFLLIPSIGIGLANVGLDFGISEKLFEEDVTPNSFSRIDRLESIRGALQLFGDAPVWGQGLQTYGFLSNDLIEGPLLTYYDESYRRIANNIYAELGAELGAVGLLLFSAFLASMIRQVLKRGGAGRVNWLMGVLGVLLYWNAFPTYSVVFIWGYFGMMLKSLPLQQAKRPSSSLDRVFT